MIASPPVARITKYAGTFTFATSTPYVAFLGRFLDHRLRDTSLPQKECTQTSDCSNGVSRKRRERSSLIDQASCVLKQCVLSFSRFHDAYGTGIEWDYALQGFRLVDVSKPAWTQSK